MRILAEKAKSIGKLPSLAGLRDTFRSGVSALLGGDPAAAVSIFTALDTRFPDFFEIKNNLAACHFSLGNIHACRDLLQAIKTIPHNEKLNQSNLEFLR